LGTSLCEGLHPCNTGVSSIKAKKTNMFSTLWYNRGLWAMGLSAERACAIDRRACGRGAEPMRLPA